MTQYKYCKLCGKEFTAKTNVTTPQVYCSPLHQRRAHKARQKSNKENRRLG